MSLLHQRPETRNYLRSMILDKNTVSRQYWEFELAEGQDNQDELELVKSETNKQIDYTLLHLKTVHSKKRRVTKETFPFPFARFFLQTFLTDFFYRLF
jgi:hypothetical protein